MSPNGDREHIAGERDGGSNAPDVATSDLVARVNGSTVWDEKEKGAVLIIMSNKNECFHK